MNTQTKNNFLCRLLPATLAREWLHGVVDGNLNLVYRREFLLPFCLLARLVPAYSQPCSCSKYGIIYAQSYIGDIRLT